MSIPPNLEDYLKLNYATKGQPYTHTRIGDKELKIAGGLYNILDNKKFMEKYYKTKSSLDYLKKYSSNANSTAVNKYGFLKHFSYD